MRTCFAVLGVLLFFATPLEAGTGIWNYYTFPAVANAPGAFGTYFKTDVSIVNPATWKTLPITIAFLPTNTNNRSVTRKSITVGPGVNVTIENVLEKLFGIVGSGAIVLWSDDHQLFTATSRTYTNGSSGSYGLGAPGQAYVNYSGERALLPGLRDDVSFRSNVGVLVISTETSSCSLEVADENGVIIGRKTVSLPANGHTQVSIQSVTGRALASGWAAWTCTTESDAEWLAYATVVDNQSGDSIFISDTRENVPTTCAYIAGNYGITIQDATCKKYIYGQDTIKQAGCTFSFTDPDYATFEGTIATDKVTFTVTYLDGGMQTGCGGVKVDGSGTISLGSSIRIDGTYGLSRALPPGCACIPPTGTVTISMSQY